jgi:hypothetical protein
LRRETIANESISSAAEILGLAKRFNEICLAKMDDVRTGSWVNWFTKREGLDIQIGEQIEEARLLFGTDTTIKRWFCSMAPI